MTPTKGKLLFPLLLFFALTSALSSCAPKLTEAQRMAKKAVKRGYEAQRVEMRGVWMPTVGRTYYRGKTPQEIRAYLTEALDRFEKLGINAVFFQVRSEGDAFYASGYEPWSRYLTGTQGKAPSPYWDPLDFMIKEAHKRHMELHAWINPYRVALNASEPVSPLHVTSRHPEWCVKYGDLILLNPALKEVRDYTADIVRDLVSRYDLDGIHMDDYFYPYPVAGVPFPDAKEYRLYGGAFKTVGDFRRENVNLLIQELHETVKALKPWVRFGISPFGIYRNKRTDPIGSDTKGLQNYDDLYADVLLWDQMGWVDYTLPQIYWQMGHKQADYTELAYWWKNNIRRGHLYFGQHIRNTMDYDQLEEKWAIAAETSQGNVLWPHEDVLENYKNFEQDLGTFFWKNKAILPPSDYPDYLRDFPEPARDAAVLKGDAGQELVWMGDPELPQGLETKYYVVYTHRRGATEREIMQAQNLTVMTSETKYRPLNLGGKFRLAFTVTRVDRFNHEHIIARNIPVVL